MSGVEGHHAACNCPLCVTARAEAYEAQKHDPLDANGIPRSAQGLAFRMEDHVREAYEALEKGWIPTVRWHLLSALELREPAARPEGGMYLTNEQFQMLLEKR